MSDDVNKFIYLLGKSDKIDALVEEFQAAYKKWEDEALAFAKEFGAVHVFRYQNSCPCGLAFEDGKEPEDVSLFRLSKRNPVIWEKDRKFKIYVPVRNTKAGKALDLRINKLGVEPNISKFSTTRMGVYRDAVYGYTLHYSVAGMVNGYFVAKVPSETRVELLSRDPNGYGLVQIKLSEFVAISEENEDPAPILQRAIHIDRERKANMAYEGYNFDGLVIASKDGWDISDPMDYIAVAYAETDHASDKLSFHVKFDNYGVVTEVIAYDVATGSEVGHVEQGVPQTTALTLAA